MDVWEWYWFNVGFLFCEMILWLCVGGECRSVFISDVEFDEVEVVKCMEYVDVWVGVFYLRGVL